MKKTSGIYAITSPSGRQYIGQAQCIRTRWWEHRKHLRLGTHHCKGLQNAYAKYGEESLVFSILAVVSLEQLNEREQQELDARPRSMLYNTALFVRRPRQGLKHSEEARAKMSLAAKNRSEEYRRKLSAGRVGKTHDAASRKAMSDALSGEKHPNWGKKFGPERIENLCKAQQNRTPEWRARISASKLGGKHHLARRVSCAELAISFDTAAQAAQWLVSKGHLKASRARITSVCKGRNKTAYGFHWAYADQQPST